MVAVADFRAAYEKVRAFEGGWVDDPADRGGETYAGISRRYWPAWYGWPIIDAAKKLPVRRQGARAFSRYLEGLDALQTAVRNWYQAQWWDRLGLSALPQALAGEIFEQSVNLGRAGAGKKIQRVCNAFNYDKGTGGRLFADLKVDGVLGPKSLAALATLIQRRVSEEALVRALNAMQAAHYIDLAAANPSQRRFTDGWLKRTVAGEGNPLC